MDSSPLNGSWDETLPPNQFLLCVSVTKACMKGSLQLTGLPCQLWQCRIAQGFGNTGITLASVAAFEVWGAGKDNPWDGLSVRMKAGAEELHDACFEYFLLIFLPTCKDLFIVTQMSVRCLRKGARDLTWSGAAPARCDMWNFLHVTANFACSFPPMF